jgi:hypothetical protein
LFGLIAVAGFTGGAANYEFNVSGRSWWESSDDAQATFNAGMEGLTVSTMAAVVAMEAAVALPAVVVEAGIAVNNPQIASWGFEQMGLNAATKACNLITPEMNFPDESVYPEYENGIFPSDIQYHRPYIRQWVRKEVESAAPKTSDGRFIDPNTNEPIDGPYDLGHGYGNEYHREVEEAKKERLTQKEFNNRMNNPKKYQIESRSSNRGHRYEKPRGY